MVSNEIVSLRSTTEYANCGKHEVKRYSFSLPIHFLLWYLQSLKLSDSHVDNARMHRYGNDETKATRYDKYFDGLGSIILYPMCYYIKCTN